MSTCVIHHSADYDGLFCREVARKFLPDAKMIGWDFTDAPLVIPNGFVYVFDLPLDRVFGFHFRSKELIAQNDPAHTNHVTDFCELLKRVCWIDHHKSAIESHPQGIPGYRIDGVAACRLAWQWFTQRGRDIGGAEFFAEASRQDFINRKVSEPLAVRLAGEYDVWDHRDAMAIPFQFGLDTEIDNNELMWKWLLGWQGGEVTLPSGNVKWAEGATSYVQQICAQGKCAMECYRRRDAEIIRQRSFVFEFCGLKFLALNTARCSSQSFAAKDVPETGHDALMGFWFNGRMWTVSMYHAKHRTDLDLSEIAVKHGGGGHRGACGFSAEHLPWITGTNTPIINTCKSNPPSTGS